MKMVCKINEGRGWFGKLPLTVGKAYEVIDTVTIRFNEYRPFDYTGPIYKVVNDEGKISGYDEDVLRPLTKEEERDEKLSDIGI
jgi:hypothetical protein